MQGADSATGVGGIDDSIELEHGGGGQGFAIGVGELDEVVGGFALFAAVFEVPACIGVTGWRAG